MNKFVKEAEKELARLSAEREMIDIKIKALQSFIEASKVTLKFQTKEKETVSDKIVRIFRREGRSLHYTEILELLERDENYKTKAKDPKAVMTAILSTNPRFVRVERGVYTLEELKRREEEKKPTLPSMENKEMTGE